MTRSAARSVKLPPPPATDLAGVEEKTERSPLGERLEAASAALARLEITVHGLSRRLQMASLPIDDDKSPDVEMPVGSFYESEVLSLEARVLRLDYLLQRTVEALRV